MKVLLLNPFLTIHSDNPAGISPALGLGYLAAYLEQNGIEVAILDIAAEGIHGVRKIGEKLRYGLSREEIERRIKDYSPQIAAITCQSTLHAQDAHQTAQIVKEIDKNILVVMGGAHASAAPQEVLKDENIDIVVIGEGEITFLEVVRNFQKNKGLDKILGTFTRKQGNVIENPPRPFIKDIDMLPFPARHLLPMDIYLKEMAKQSNYLMRRPALTIISSRGCPGNCIYCSVRTVWGRFWRSRSPKNVVDEMESLIKDYGAREIHFLDDSISVDKERLKGICDEIIKRKLNIKWTTPNGIAIWLLDKELLIKMKKAGCYRLTFGLESGSTEVLHNYVGKYYDFEKAREIIKFCSSIGFWTVGTFIIGFPYETRKQINDTVNFAISTELDFAVFYIANPFPGTRMYEDYKKEGLLPKSGAYELVRGCQTKHFSHKQLVILQAEAFNCFMKSRLKNPWRFLNKIKSFEDLIYTLKLGKIFSKLLLNQSSIKTKGITALWK